MGPHLVPLEGLDSRCMSEICGSRSSTCYTYLHAIRSTAVAAATRATASQAVAAAVAVAVALAVVGTGAGAGAVFFEPWMKVVLVVIALLVVLLLVVVVLEILVAPVVTSTSIGRNTNTGLHKEWVRTFWDQNGKCKLSRLLSRSLSRSDPTLGTENWPCHMCASSYAETTAILLYGKEERNRKRERERGGEKEKDKYVELYVYIYIFYTHTHICICEYIYIYTSI